MASCASPISHPHSLYSDHHLSPFPISAFPSPRPSLTDLLHFNDSISSPLSLSIHKKKNPPPRKTVDLADSATRAPAPHELNLKENCREFDDSVVQPCNPACLQPTPSISLKRKRPAKLDIPEFARLASFGKAKEFQISRMEASFTEPKGYETSVFGVYSRKGRKEYMEDTHTAVTDFEGKPGQALFAVFDGHGGMDAATFAADNLAKHISKAIDQESCDSGSMVDAMQAGYLALDSEFLSKNTSSGACSVSAFLKDGRLTVANAGDCKAVLCRNGKAEALNTLHRASNPEERQRIENLGGYVDCFNGVWRVQATLAVTRGFGDVNLKQWVSAEPEVRHLPISNDCEFLILATDGLWDKMDDQEAVDCAREALNGSMKKRSVICLESETPRTLVSAKNLSEKNIQQIETGYSNGALLSSSSSSSSSSKVEACKKLVHTACSRGNLDDITVVIVLLEGFYSSTS